MANVQHTIEGALNELVEKFLTYQLYKSAYAYKGVNAVAVSVASCYLNSEGSIYLGCCALQEVAKKQKKKLYLRLTADTSTPQVQQKLKQILRQHNGPMPVYFYFSEQKKMVLAEYHYWVSSDIDLIMALSQLLGAENISVKEE